MRARALVIVLSSVVIGSCAGQPPPACPVAVGSPLGVPPGGSPLGFSPVQFGLPNFWASYKPQSGTGACATLPGEEIGFQKFETPFKPDDSKVAIRPFLLSFIHGNPLSYGAQDFADYDPSNDTGDDGQAAPTVDAVFRTDPSDPEGLLINALGGVPAAPAADNTCQVSGELVNEQTFQAETLALVPPQRVLSARAEVDAGTAVFPELHVRYAWSNLKFVSTSEVPGSLFTAQLEYTEDACTATYEVTGVWPITLCHTDLDCSPDPLPDVAEADIGIPGRRFQGSGLNPAFQDEAHPFKCNNSDAVHAYTANYALTDFEGNPVYGITDWGVCEMTKPVSDFTAAP